MREEKKRMQVCVYFYNIQTLLWYGPFKKKKLNRESKMCVIRDQIPYFED